MFSAGILAANLLRAGGGGGDPGAYGDHAYWALSATSTHGGTTVELAGLAFKDGAGNSIPTTGGTPLGNLVFGDGLAAIFDSNPATRGTGTTTGPWVAGYQFAAPVGVEQIILTHYTDYLRAPLACELIYSDDGSTWTTAFAFTNALPVAGATIPFPEPLDPGFARAFDLFIVDNNGDANFIEVAEVELRSTSGGADQTANIIGNPSLGRVVSSTQTAGGENFRACDNSASTQWRTSSPNVTNQRWMFISPAPVKVEEIAVTASTTTARAPKNMQLRRTADGATFTAQKTFDPQTAWTSGETRVLAAV